MRTIQIAPSILSADFGKLNQEIAEVAPYCDLIHVDVMDGHFVPNLSLGAPVVSSIRSTKPLDVHLMIEHAEKYLEPFAKAVERAVGPRLKKESFLVVHQEATANLPRVIRKIHHEGLLAGVALNPRTPLKTIFHVLDQVDMVLLMTVNPGFGGQAFISSVLSKIRTLRKMAPHLDIEVDGGINNHTARLALEAGANVIVSGSFVFGSQNRKKALVSLKAKDMLKNYL